MAILYDWYENPVSPTIRRERFASPHFLNGKVGTDKLCRMIHGRSSLSVGDVKMRSRCLPKFVVKNYVKDARYISRG